MLCLEMNEIAALKIGIFFLASPVSLPSGKKLMPHGSRKIKLVAVNPLLLKNRVVVHILPIWPLESCKRAIKANR